MPSQVEPRPHPPSTDPANPGGFVHIPALDGIRGTAILLVLVVHLFESNNQTGSRLFDVIQRIFASTYIGVNLFFALSGFLITGILLDTLHISHFFKTFYARRSLRIFPLYYGFLLVALCLTHPLHLVWNGWQYFYLTYSANLALWRSDVPLVLGYFNLNHFWSLQVEEQFYLLWPFIIFRIRKLDTLVKVCLYSCGTILTLRIVLVALLLQHFLVNKYLIYFPTFSCADNLLYGCLLCILLRTRWRQTVIRRAPLVLAVSAVLLVLMAMPTSGLLYQFADSPSHVFVPTLGFSLLPIAASAMIAMALRPGSKTQHLFERPFLRFFGKYSYGLYVLHYPIHLWLQLPLRTFFLARFHSKAISALLEAVIVAVLSVLAAVLSYYLYESQFLKLKRYFSYRSTGQRGISPSA
jgi:peptidoglycan/LPS O-acetylase OafA/YrhL